MNILPDPEMDAPSPPSVPEYTAPRQLRERRYIESTGGCPAMDGEKMNKPARVMPPPFGPPLRRRCPSWQEEEDLFAPEQEEGMEEDQGDLDNRLLPVTDQEPLEGLPAEEDMEDLDPGLPGVRSPPRTRGWVNHQRMDLRTEDEAGVASPDQGEGQPMDYQQAALPEERAGQDEVLERPRPNTHSQARAGQRRVTFQQDLTTSREFESTCIRMPDGTIDMEPANLANMCTILETEAKIPYRQQ
ncbi:MAG: hypothetical protein GY696_27980 [Gammaproteobacteria bacterium]|nr:hypothetical protein [Gammaproteobacteria bacterium]